MGKKKCLHKNNSKNSVTSSSNYFGSAQFEGGENTYFGEVLHEILNFPLSLKLEMWKLINTRNSRHLSFLLMSRMMEYERLAMEEERVRGRERDEKALEKKSEGLQILS